MMTLDDLIRGVDDDDAPKRKPGYFNDDNYYSFASDEEGVWVLSECCGDLLDLEAAQELRDMLNDWLDGRTKC